ncbi:Uncharacterised protein [Mycobacteroides abscessus subsp. abscessus]|nr:Uncharacterised protein [Mycobacteroides abscessus subsp. abscessus]
MSTSNQRTSAGRFNRNALLSSPQPRCSTVASGWAVRNSPVQSSSARARSVTVYWLDLGAVVRSMRGQS